MNGMELLNQIQKPVLLVVIAAITVLTIVIIYKYIKLKGLNGIRMDVYEAILRAEHIYSGYDAGRKKFKYVLHQARMLMPGWLQLIITDAVLEETVELWYQGVKDLLDDGKINESQKSKTEMEKAVDEVKERIANDRRE